MRERTASGMTSAEEQRGRVRRARFAGQERLVVGTLSVGLFLALWQIVALSGVIDPMFVSSPSRIASVALMMIDEKDFWRDVSVSTQEFLTVISAPFWLVCRSACSLAGHGACIICWGPS